MSDPTPAAHKPRPNISLPNGKTLKPRAEFADEIGVCERTVKRLNPDTVYIGNVAYIDHEGTLNLIAAKLKRKNQPRKGGPATDRQRRRLPA